jgi:hypothetical protein
MRARASTRAHPRAPNAGRSVTDRAVALVVAAHALTDVALRLPRVMSA